MRGEGDDLPRPLGHRQTDDPAFTLRPTPHGIRLLSRHCIPAETLPDSPDHRRLGVAIAALAADGIALPLDDPRLATGWHAPEAALRWTDGDALIALPPTTRLTVTLAPTGARYWLRNTKQKGATL